MHFTFARYPKGQIDMMKPLNLCKYLMDYIAQIHHAVDCKHQFAYNYIQTCIHAPIHT